MFTGIARKICLSIICVFAVGFPPALHAQELKPIRISLSLGSAQLPLWVARDAGLFAKHGLNPELLGLQSAS
ncbi:MAG TPA: hypothetical protein VNT76_15060, partial [Candidatus Binatus sp.]|nr:hypothetical protein [Candidatus Binatus sp.]